MDKIPERVFEVVLVLVAVLLAAAGVAGAIVAAVGIGGGLLILAALAVARFVRQRRSKPAVAAARPQAASTPAEIATRERDRLLRQGAEAPAKRSERERLIHDARQTARTYRAMTDANGISETAPETRAAWLDRVIDLHRRLGEYADRWQIVVPDTSNLAPLAPPVQPDWLEAMARDADTVAWQLDHENGGQVRTHQLVAVGGTRSTCSCGMTFDTGPAFSSHVAERA